MMFDWKTTVPVWAVLWFMGHRDVFRAVGGDIHMAGWKSTPKGGKLTYTSLQGVDVTVQIYK